MDQEKIAAILRENGLTEDKIGEGLHTLDEQFPIARVEDFYAIGESMTNYLFHFRYMGKRYLIRIPGENTEYLLDRYQEAWAYRTLSEKNITDPLVYINPGKGIKIAEYIDGAHTCDKDSEKDVRSCISHLRDFHQLEVEGGKEFDVFEKLVLYEKNCRHDICLYIPEYHETRKKIMSLREIVKRAPKEKRLCHIDPIPDNFLLRDGKVYLIDWEYAALSDPHIDIAMFCVYSNYDKEQIDKVIRLYFDGDCGGEVKNKIYAYIAACGLLWVVWCEIKRDAGILFEEYEKRQYHYAVEFSKYILEDRKS